jgi:RHS repeat-associated protein
MLTKELIEKRFDFFWDKYTTEYSYDAVGRRIERRITNHQDTSKSFNRRYVYDGNEILFEMDGDNKILATYTHSMLRTDDVLAMDVTADGVSAGLAPSTNSYHFIKDGLSTTFDIVNSQGNLVQHYNYSAFGNILKISDAANLDVTANPIIKTPFTFTGREFDSESGLYYFRARYYFPSIGRFLQKDGYAGSIGSPLSFNRYAFNMNDPINRIDPSGNVSFKKAMGYLSYSAWPAGGFAAMNTTNFFTDTFGFSKKDESTINQITITVAIIAAAVVTGGAAGAWAGGAVSGFFAGAAAGAATGAVVGGTLTVVAGEHLLTERKEERLQALLLVVWQG